jgi:hypothetical protein
MTPNTKVICVDPAGVFYPPLILYGSYTIERETSDYYHIKERPTIGFLKKRFFVPIYNVGDQVVYVHDGYGLQKGEIYTIGKAVISHDGVNQIVSVNGEWCNSCFFIPVNIYKPQSKQPCPDCGGSGIYKGLFVVETCKLCNGNKVC